jgi:hypothetical protein
VGDRMPSIAAPSIWCQWKRSKREHLLFSLCPNK